MVDARASIEYAAVQVVLLDGAVAGCDVLRVMGVRERQDADDSLGAATCGLVGL